ncbi:preprotein translocase subunit YajC [Nocardia spumae]|uniref:preprotein translocase subunit YajC n=1 Tax=Nocardia spumae TaxID=2887190 RepID=UPI001D158D02|nr:preprotein translocase subunit YajC [Nocardia spumae]
MANLLFPLLLVVLLVPMFLGVRRQKREAEKVTAMQESVKVGDRVTTTSGLYGTVVDIDDETVDLEIAEDVVTTWLRAAIRDVRSDADAAGDNADAGSEETTVAEIADASPVEAAAPAEGADRHNGAPVLEESVDDTAARLRKD